MVGKFEGTKKIMGGLRNVSSIFENVDSISIMVQKLPFN